MEKYKALFHASIRFEFGKKVIYVDPYNISGNPKDADYIFITHPHYDHYSEADIKRVEKRTTKFVMPKTMALEAKYPKNKEKITYIVPKKKYQIDDIKFETIPAYNILRPFHLRMYGWVGYVFTDPETNERYYVMGDTDATIEASKVKANIVFIPVGGTYTMDYKEAANLILKMKPDVAIPIHYGSIVGSSDKEGLKFRDLLLGQKINTKVIIEV